MDKPILPACYLPPISYFRTMVQSKDTGVWIEQYEHFPKQTYRNRASIYGANGKLDLIIPVKKGSSHNGHTKMKDVRISYESDWQRLHWLSLQTAYRSAAYFEYYEDRFVDFYKQTFPYLMEFNLQLTQLLLDLIKIETPWVLTDRYHKEYPSELDFRGKIHPKKTDQANIRVYHQVFGDRHGFLPDLSIVDLLFNFGPQSLDYLRKGA